MIIEIILTNILAWIIALGIFAMQRAHDMQERERTEMLLDWKKLYDVCTSTLDAYRISRPRDWTDDAGRDRWSRLIQTATTDAYFVELKSSDSETRALAADIVKVLLTMHVDYVMISNQGVTQRGGGQLEYDSLEALEDRIVGRLSTKFERNERLNV